MYRVVTLFFACFVVMRIFLPEKKEPHSHNFSTDGKKTYWKQHEKATKTQRKKMAEWLNMAASSFWQTRVPRVARREVFSHTFGCIPEDCVIVWAQLGHRSKLRSDIRPIHLLWMMFFLRHYATMPINAMTVGCTEKTFSDKVHFLIRQTASILHEFVSVFFVGFVVLR